MNIDHERTVASILQMMRSKLDDQSLTLERLAAKSHYSPFHLDRVFRSITGIPPRTFLSALRMEEAKKRLLKAENTATEIGQEVGYSSFGTFSTRFTQLVGVPPSKFRACMEACTSRLRQYYEAGLAQADETYGSIRGVTCRVSVPDGFDGFICAGLFPRPIPQGRPAACMVAFSSGHCWLPPVPDGTYYLLCSAFGWETPEEEFLFPKTNLRGIHKKPIRVVNGTSPESPNVTLRSPRWYDPPLLVSIPFLLANFLERYDSLPRERAN